MNDIRRWAQGMQNPNPLYYDEALRRGEPLRAASWRRSRSRSAPTRPRRRPAIQGVDPRHAHALRRRRVVVLRAADRARRRDPPRPHAVRLQGARDRSSPGPTMFSRGDTTYINQRGELVASSAPPRSATWPRTRASSACSRTTSSRTWTDEELADLEEAEARLLPELPRPRPREAPVRAKVGDKLPRRPIGPHTIADLHDRVALVPDDGLGRVATTAASSVAPRRRLAARDVARPRRREDRPDAAPTASTRARRAATCRRATRS